MCSKRKQIRFFRHNWAFIQMLRFTVLISCLNRFCWVIIMVLFRHFCSVTGSVTSRKFWNKKPLKRSYYLIYWSQSLSQMHRSTFRFVVVSFAQTYRKIPKISPGAYILQKPLRSLCTEENLRFKIDWTSLWWEGILLCFTLDLRANSKYKPPQGGLYSERWFNGGVFALRVCRAYIWRG